MHGDGVGAVHGRGEAQRIHLPADGVEDAAVVVADGDDVDAGEGVEVALAVDVPVVHAVGLRHDERRLTPLGHLVAHEDVTEELFLGRLGVGDQVGERRRGHGKPHRAPASPG